MKDMIIISCITLGIPIAAGFGYYVGSTAPKPEQHRPICSIPERQWEGIKECRSKCYWQDRMEKVK
jgi:hypothetical protein